MTTASQRPIGFTPDGATLIFEDYQGVWEPHDLWMLPVLSPGAEPTRLTGGEFAESHGSVSPDGNFIAYQSEEPGYPEVFVRSFPDFVGGRMISTLDRGQDTSLPNADPREARGPVWARNGDEIFYESGGFVVRVPVSTSDGFNFDAPEVAFSGEDWPWTGEGRNYDPHPDGRFVRIRRPRTSQSDAPNELVVVLDWIRLLDIEGPS